ncbi:cellulase family glycosylhydrolase [Bacteroides sp. 1001136B_160425_E2]|uniref:cellulase family glycosylhydrolase n=1 Tax=Bacteroides sp. 1001136B_160425_E2 TaxID=2787083 RepID=UPI0018A0B90B|nr:cellulase family glycosylhydrolase [Bacteroides sp. 1001136B_160425_E2]
MEKQSFSDGLFSPLGIKRVIFVLVLLTTSLISCSNSDEKGGSLEVAQEYRNLEFDARGSRQTIQIDGPSEWHISSSESWCKSSHTIGEGKQYVNITVEANDTQKERTATVTVSASGTPDIIINVKQSIYSIPAYDEYIAPDNTGMRDLTSMQLSALMKAGVNVGNTFEAVIVGEDGSLSGDETCWGNPTPNKALFEGIKAAGFDVVRMPVAYSHQFEDAVTYKIKSAWLDKVEAAVEAALDAGLYVIINIHWEGGWLNHPADANKEALDERLEAMWKQIALRFRDYDDRLLFAGTNEVNNDDANGAQPTEENYRVQNGFNQVFVNTVRATGGRNHYRHLIVQAYNTDVAKAVAHFTMPLDIVQNRIFLECHYYDPYDFTIMPNEENFKSQWGSAFAGGNVSSTGQEGDIEATLSSLNVFINDNVPVIIGEYGPTLRDQLTGEALENHLKSRNDYIEYVVKTCVKNKLVPLYWDAGYTEKLFDRTTGQPHNAASIASIMEGLN